MAEVHNSTTLVAVLEYAKVIGNNESEIISKAKFFMALADMLGITTSDEEIKKSKELFEDNGISIDVLHRTATALVKASPVLSYTEGMYLERKMFEAKGFVEMRGEFTLTLDALVQHMLESDRTIHNLVNPYIAIAKREAQERADKDVKGRMATLVTEIKEMQATLKSKVYGQDNAISTFATGYFQAVTRSLVDKNRKGPKATFLFAGAPGVGKTFLAESIAELLDLPYRRFDMSGYVDKEASIEFAGSNQVFKNSKSGNVTGYVAENPRCILLFDEIEKAHTSVINLFLQMLDVGRLRDGFTDKEISFEDAIIIFTTNAGKQLYENAENVEIATIPQKIIVNALKEDINPQTQNPYFPSALCSRFTTGNIVMFNNITPHHLKVIAEKELNNQIGLFEQNTDMQIGIDKNTCTALMLSLGGTIDARTVTSKARKFLNDEIYELFRFVSSEKTNINILNLKKINVKVDLSDSSPDITSLFNTDKNSSILVFADRNTINKCKKHLPDCKIIGTQSCKSAIKAIKEKDVDFVLLDLKCGVSAETQNSLNIYDIDSEARDFFMLLTDEKNSTPVYVLEPLKNEIVEEEKFSLIEQGIRGFLSLKDTTELSNNIKNIVETIHQQQNVIKLSKENKVLKYETAQSVIDGENAEIKLFDFKLITAVDAKDSENILSSIQKPNVKFSDIIGAKDAKTELTYFVNYLKNPKKYVGTGVKAPKGVLLHGPSGTGKTMLAKAMATEAGVTFIATEGNAFLNAIASEGAKKVHEYFKLARKYAPSVLFVDEIDAIGKARGNGVIGADAILTAFLTEMDGFVNDPSRPVFVLAATNFDVDEKSNRGLDSALTRRFDRRIYVTLPNKADRIKFMKLKISANKTFNISKEKIENIAIRATGMSLANLDSVFELALRSAIRNSSTIVTDNILDEAFETFNNGEVKKWDKSQLMRVARHEAGHALVCYANGETPSYLTVVPRGNRGGYMQHDDTEGKLVYTRDELLTKIRIALGGRAAEIVYYGEENGLSTGACGDLEKATGIATEMFCNYGMFEDFGMATLDPDKIPEIRSLINVVIDTEMKNAITLITANKKEFDELTKELLNKNYLVGQDVEKILK